LLEVRVPGHHALHRQHLLSGARAQGDPVRTGRGLQRPERTGLVRIAVGIGHVGRALFFDQHPSTGEQLHHAADDLVQHRLQRLGGWRRHFDELRHTVGTVPVQYRHVPRKLIDRPKMGFSLPLGVWLRGPLREWAEALLFPQHAPDDPIDSAELRRLWAEHQSGARDWHQTIWSVLMFRDWRATRRTAARLAP
jgi:hypothetical protein